MIVGIHENLGGIKPREIKTRYTVVFDEILPMLKIHRNAMAHGFSHAFYAQDINWLGIWKLLENLTDVEKKKKSKLPSKSSVFGGEKSRTTKMASPPVNLNMCSARAGSSTCWRCLHEFSVLHVQSVLHVDIVYVLHIIYITTHYTSIYRED